MSQSPTVTNIGSGAFDSCTNLTSVTIGNNVTSIGSAAFRFCTNVILSWPISYAGFSYAGYTLQSTTNLLSPSAWVTNSPVPVVINGQNTVTNPISGAQQYYRLVR